MHKLACVLTLGVCLTSSASAALVLNYTSQTRSVTAMTFGPSGNLTQTLSSSTLAPFDSTAHEQDVTGFANQHQKSDLLPNAISVVGDFAGQQPSFAGAGVAKGETLTDVHFTIASLTNVALTVTANLTNLNLFNATETVSLTGPGTSIVFTVQEPLSTPPAQQANYMYNGFQSATLAPGSYHFVVDLNSSVGAGNQGNRVNSFDVELVPEPASFAVVLAGALALGLRDAAGLAREPRDLLS